MAKQVVIKRILRKDDKMNNYKHFIKTADNSTADKLRTMGYQELSFENGIHTFLNDSNKIQFSSDIDQSKIKLTNMLCM